MQVTNINLCYNFYNPATGEPIISLTNGYNHSAESLVGYWVDEDILEPFFKSELLEKAWISYYKQVENDVCDHKDHQKALIEFLLSYQEPDRNLHAFVLNAHTGCDPGDELMWLVVDLDDGI